MPTAGPLPWSAHWNPTICIDSYHNHRSASILTVAFATSLHACRHCMLRMLLHDAVHTLV